MFKRTSTVLLVVAALLISCSKNPTGPAKAAPVITQQPYSTLAVLGNTCSFSVAATGNPTPTYQWQWSSDSMTWTDLSGSTATDSIFTIQSVAFSDSGFYRVVVSNSLGIINSNAVKLLVGVLPIIIIQPLSDTVIAGDSATFHVVAAGYPAPTYQWQQDGYNVTTSNVTATSADLIIYPVTPGDAGNYSVMVTNTPGYVNSNTVTLTVLVAPSITTEPAPQSVVDSGSVTFSVAAGGNFTPTYQWQRMANGGTTWADIAGETNSSLTFTAHYADSGALFRAIATNSAGSAISDGAALTVTITAPNMLSPINGATDVSTTPTLTWSVFPGAASYWVMVDTSLTFNTAQSFTPTTATVNISTPLINGVTYYWKLVAFDGVGNPTSVWTPVWSFTTTQ